MNYLQFDFEVRNNEQSEKLVALLSEKGFEGFEEEPTILKAFIAEKDFKEDAFLNVVELF